MVSFPNAKINLGLNIVSKRTDGFHHLESCFYPVQWTDILEILPSEKLIFTSSGTLIPGAPEENLCVKVYTKIKEDYDIPSVHIHLHKNIPIGAGLGGGSSDAAFTLKILNKLFDLKLAEEEMEDYVRPLGSDCAFFIKNKPVFAFNKGDEFEKLSVDLSGKFIVLIYPDIHISTKEAYNGVQPLQPEIPIKNIVSDKILSWKSQLKNDFENSILLDYPELFAVKERLYQMGAFYVSMTGSGSAIYGLFEKEIIIKGLFPEKYKTFTGFL